MAFVKPSNNKHATQSNRIGMIDWYTNKSPEMKKLSLKFISVSLLWFLSLIPAAFGNAIADASIANSSVPDQSQPLSTNFLVPLSTQQDRVLLAAPDGTLYLVGITTRSIIWSFKSGPALYSAHQEVLIDGDTHNASRHFFIDCGDDWELYMHRDLKGVKLQFTADELIAQTPHISADGVMTGVKKTTVFLVDAKYGNVVHTFPSEDFFSGRGLSIEGTPGLVKKDLLQWLQSATSYESVDQPLLIKRKDYGFKYSASKTGKILWYLMFSDFEASYPCRGGPLSKGFQFGGKDCQTTLLVYRVRDRSLLESILFSIGLPNSGGMISTLAPDQSPIPKLPAHLALPAPVTEVPSRNDSLTPSNPFGFGVRSLAVLFAVMVSLVFYWFRSVFVKVFVKVFVNQGKEPAVVFRRLKTKRRKSKNKNTSAVETTEGGNGLQASDDRKVIGKLTVFNKEIARGSHGTIVREGLYDGRPVAVKRLVETHHNIADKEIDILMASDRNTNIVRLYGVERDTDFIYLSLERCICNLDDLILSPPRSFESLDKEVIVDLWDSDAYPTPQLLKVFRDIVTGIAYLHRHGIIHRDLKPQNVLICIEDNTIKAKIADMGISKRLVQGMTSLTKQTSGCGTSGWQAPEQLRKRRYKEAVDMFSLGCVIFYCLTKGQHPFGATHERDANIYDDNKAKGLFLIDGFPEALDLIRQLLDPTPESRPKAGHVLNHPFFWTSETRLSFLRDVSDLLERGDIDLVNAIESIRPAIGGNWNKKLDGRVIKDIPPYGHSRWYDYTKVRDLLRLIRNKFSHYPELSPYVQSLLEFPDGFEVYFSARYPKLLIEVYKVIKIFCREEVMMDKYFKTLQE